MRLTDIQVKNLKAPVTGAKIYYDDTLKGFGVRVSQAGTKAFILATGKNRDRRTIGRYPHISLADARKAAQTLIGEHASGKRQPSRLTFGAALEAFLAFHEAANRPGTASEVRRILTKQFSDLHRLKLADVTTHNITKITDKMIDEGHPSAANHAHMAARTFLHWCRRRRHIEHSPLEGLEKPAPTRSRERVLSDDELCTVWRAANATTGHYGAIVKLLILTGQRRGEIASLKAEWCSLGGAYDRMGNSHCAGHLRHEHQPENTKSPHSSTVEHQHGVVRTKREGDVCSTQTGCSCTINLPSSITKNRRPHTFPIGALAATTLSSNITEQTTILFPARGSTNKSYNGWSKGKTQLDKNIANHFTNADKMAPWTLHDLRRTYATNLQRLGIKLEVIEQLLNHISGTRSGIVGVYQRHAYEAEMREAVGIHEKWLQSLIDKE